MYQSINIDKEEDELVFISIIIKLDYLWGIFVKFKDVIDYLLNWNKGYIFYSPLYLVVLK